MILRLLRHLYHYGLLSTIRRVVIDRSMRPTGMGTFYFVRYGVKTIGGHSLTFKGGFVRRLVNESHDVEVFLSHIYGGGATSYLRNWIESSPADRLIFIVCSTEVVGVLVVEAYRANKKHCTFFVRGLSAFFGLKGKKCRIVVSELLTWEKYWPEGLMSNRRMNELCRRIVDLKNALQSELLYCVHDFYSMCPRFDLVTPEYRYCDSEYTLEKCERCLGDAQNYKWHNVCGINIVEWRKSTKSMLDACTEIRAFSEDSLKRITRCWPNLKVTLLPHKFVGGFTRKPKIIRDKLTIGVVGKIQRHKGSEEVVALGQYLLTQKKNDVRIVVVGNLHVDTDRIPSNVIVLGAYQTNELPDIIERENINVAFFSSVCVESFSYVTQELMALGLPIVCYDVGAPRDRIRVYPDGKIIPEVTPEATWQTINELFDEMKVKYGAAK